MRFLLNLLLGYCVFEIDSKHVKSILNISNSQKIPILSFKIKGEKTYFNIHSKFEKSVFDVAVANSIGVNIIKRFGLPVLVQKYKHRIGFILGMIVMLSSFLISPMFIWDVSITGNQRLSREYVTEMLDAAGVKIGAFSPKILRSDVYEFILTNSDEIAWISVNFIGSTAHVEITERDYKKTSSSIADGANIIASTDGRILDTDIIKGRRVVRNNDVVKKGELLVSGIYNSNRMGTRYVYADAKVYANVLKEIEVEIPLNSFKKEYLEEKVVEAQLKIFKKSVNIFKNYSKTTDNYDTIIRKESIPFFGFEKLPLVLESVIALPYKKVPILLSVDEAVNAAELEIYRIISDLDLEDIIARESSYEIIGESLIYKCHVDAIKNIAQISEFDID